MQRAADAAWKIVTGGDAIRRESSAAKTSFGCISPPLKRSAEKKELNEREMLEAKKARLTEREEEIAETLEQLETRKTEAGKCNCKWLSIFSWSKFNLYDQQSLNLGPGITTKRMQAVSIVVQHPHLFQE